jgi:hypothetical protein
VTILPTSLRFFVLNSRTSYSDPGAHGDRYAPRDQNTGLI